MGDVVRLTRPLAGPAVHAGDREAGQGLIASCCQSRAVMTEPLTRALGPLVQDLCPRRAHTRTSLARGAGAAAR